MGQQGSPCYDNFKLLARAYDSKVSPVGPLIAEKLAASVLLYVFIIGFPASLFPHYWPLQKFGILEFIINYTIRTMSENLYYGPFKNFHIWTIPEFSHWSTIFTFLTIQELSHYGPFKNVHILDQYRILKNFTISEFLHSWPLQNIYVLDQCRTFTF